MCLHNMLRSWEKRGWGGADSSWVSTLLRRRTLRKREELWRQGEREVGLRGRVEHLRRDV